MPRKRLAGLILAAGALAGAASATPASASVTFQSTSYFVTTLSSTTIPPGNAYTTVVQADIPLRQGETRRVTAQLGISSVQPDEMPEVDNQLVCTQPGGQQVITSAGTNYWHPNESQLEHWPVTLLVTAAQAGTAHCELQAQTSDGHANAYTMYLQQGADDLADGTWLKISSSDEAGAQTWDYSTAYPGCDPSDSLGMCSYVSNISGSSVTRDVFGDPAHRLVWTAGNDATNVDVTGTFQVTSCPSGSKSCTAAQHSGDDYADLHSDLEVDQLNPDGSVCNATHDYGLSADEQSGPWYYITPAIHHEPLTYYTSVPVSQNCGGSRQFALQLRLTWGGGNPVKLDGGMFTAINSVRATTTTVPPVSGGTEANADAAIAAAGLTVAPTYVMSPARPGTVLSQNSPGGIVEPAGSTVQITVSNGQVTVPYVTGEDQASAMRAINNAGLNVGTISYNNNCVDPGSVLTQNPLGGVLVSSGSSVNIQVSACTGSGGGGGGSGGGGGGGGSGNPRQPK